MYCQRYLLEHINRLVPVDDNDLSYQYFLNDFRWWDISGSALEPDSASVKICRVYFLNKTISSQITNNNS